MPRKVRGVALVTALFVVMVLYFLCTVAAREAQENLRYLTLESERTRRLYLAKAGANQAVAEMMEDVSMEATYSKSDPREETYDGIVVRTWIEPDPDESTLRHVRSEAFPVGRPSEAQTFTRVVRRADEALNAVLYFRNPSTNEIMESTLGDGGMEPNWGEPLPPGEPAPSPTPPQFRDLDALPSVPHLVYAPLGPYGELQPSPLPSVPAQPSLLGCAYDNTDESLYAFTHDPDGVYWPALLKKERTGGQWEALAPLPPSPGSSPAIPMVRCGPMAAAGKLVYAVCEPGGPSPGPPQLYAFSVEDLQWTKIRDLTSANVKLSAFSINGGDKKGVLLKSGDTWEVIGDEISIDVNWGDKTCWIKNPGFTGGANEEPLIVSGGGVQETQKAICANGDLVCLWQRDPADSVLSYSRDKREAYLQKYILFPPNAKTVWPAIGSFGEFRRRIPYRREPYIKDIDAVHPTPCGEPIYEFRYGSGRYVGMRNTTPRPIPLGYDLECVGATGTRSVAEGEPQVVPAGSQ